jgi:phosphatidylserine/phosphatidylglycerophosphate/cardiolipin synthase-like enzyme
MTGDLAAALRAVVLDLPGEQIEALARAAAAHTGPTPVARAEIMAAVATSRFRDAARSVLDAWPDGLPGAAVALALRTSGPALATVRDEQRLEIVWTGPSTPEVPLRHTHAVLVEVIGAARHRLVAVSFAAHRVDEINAALAAAAARGVDVRLVLETTVDSRGALGFDAAGAFHSLGSAVSFWVWPAELRLQHERRRATQHAKAAVADDRMAFVTSANLTGQALDENMELGLLVTGGPVPRRLAAHFRQLMDDGVLRRAAQ